MYQCENTEEDVPLPKTTLCKEHDSQPKAQRSCQRQDSHGSQLSCDSLKSDWSKDFVIDFKDRGPPMEGIHQRQDSHGSEPSCVSLKSDWSKDIVTEFKDGCPPTKEVDKKSSDIPFAQSAQQDQKDLDHIFKRLEEDIVTFVKNELKQIQMSLNSDYQECSVSPCENEEALDGEDEEQKKGSKEAFLKITQRFLRIMGEEGLADLLQCNNPVSVCQHKLKSKLKRNFQCVFEGIAKAGNPTPLNEIYTELFITEGETEGVNKEHEIRQIETAARRAYRPETIIKCEDIFKPLPESDRLVRTVMTKGVAGIGKTVLTQKFTLDWAENKFNQNIQFVFPFTFRELNVLKEKEYSLVELVDYFFSETKKAGICRFEGLPVLFIFDGLDECRLPLDFHNSKILRDVTESTPVDVLLTNLIRGDLLPSAHLWITTRPAAANQIPPEYVDMVTEVRGFNDPQKEEYFGKRFSSKEKVSRIISHIKTSRSLYIMCHIPVFCWITATVLDELKTSEEGALPNTLTEMYIHFLVVESKIKHVKYDGGAEIDSPWNQMNKKMIASLGKLAFKQLQKGNLIFYESDLTECGINIKAASVYSGVFTQIFRQETRLYQDKVFCFVHLSVQEFLAALHVHLTFINSGVNLLLEEQTPSLKSEDKKDKSAEGHLYQSAVDRAIQSPNGHLDLFLRFLLGLSLQTNQTLLQGLLKQTGSSLQTNQETVKYIKKKINERLSPEKSINLFHCLNELNDRSLVEEIQQSLKSGRLSTDKLSPAEWSALVFILLSSEKGLEVFDLKEYSASEEAFLWLQPVVKASKQARLNGCNLSERGYGALSSILSSQSCSLKELDLCNNNIKDSEMKLLSAGLKSPHCTLETLRLSGCVITEEGLASLASALSSNPSHLKELDLSYNHPGDSRETLVDPHWKLDTLRTEPCGVRWLRPPLMKYSCELTFDTNTVNKNILLSDNNRKVTRVDHDEVYPDHDERFEVCQILCENGMTGRCYWEVEWYKNVAIAVAYKGIRRKGINTQCFFGENTQSWNLSICDGQYSAWHNMIKTPILTSSSNSGRVAVYLDHSAGTLSFYRVSSDTLIHLHTFNATFTEPLYVGFLFSLRTEPGFWCSVSSSSVSLCSLKE